MPRSGPLTSLTVVEFAGLGPGPFAAMMLADHGARVIRIDRPTRGVGGAAGMGSMTKRHSDVLARGRESIELDLKNPEHRETALKLVSQADVLIEGFRPGVMESLGLGPQVCLALRPSLVYGRMTGWGQSGPLSKAAGHDINYTALSGALHSTRRQGQTPTPAPGMIGDFGGGGMLLAFGVLAAITHARLTGVGQVVDAAVVDGAALLLAPEYGWHSVGAWSDEAGTNVGDSGAHFYDAYECADGKYISIGSIEPQFYAMLRDKCGLDDSLFDRQWDKKMWPELKARVAVVFKAKTRDEWCALLEGSDVCFAPVLDLRESPQHPHMKARATFSSVNGIVQPSPAPRFSATPSGKCQEVAEAGQHTRSILDELKL